MEFVSAEPYASERLAQLFRIVTNRVHMPEYEPFLLPTTAQAPSVFGNIEYFRQQGIRVREMKEFLTNTTLHSEGWAVGQLKYIATRDLANSWTELTPDTILITEEVPRDLPPIAGFSVPLA